MNLHIDETPQGNRKIAIWIYCFVSFCMKLKGDCKRSLSGSLSNGSFKICYCL